MDHTFIESGNPQSAHEVINSLDGHNLLNRLSEAFNGTAHLRTDGFHVMPSILPIGVRQDAVEDIWNFYEDISNGKVTRGECQSWSNFYPSQGHFSSWGAGWLLGRIREHLSKTIFEDAFGTSKLHSSKEGFRLMINESSTVVQTPFRRVEPGRSSYLRALVALSAAVKCRFNLPDGTQDVDLKCGDVLLFRSDLQVEEEYVAVAEGSDYRQIPIVTYCSMHPAPNPDSPKMRQQQWNEKIEAYKQRFTGSFELNSDGELEINDDIGGRNYFRTMPALVSRHLAHLYGLLPYDSEDPEEDLKRARIRGVCFDDDTFEELPGGVRPPIGAQSVQLTSSDTQILSGQDKYLGGMASPCGKYIYGVPGGARRVLRISVETGTLDCIGPSYDGKFKWLRGVEVSSVAMKGHKDYPNGCCVALPCNHLSLLKVNPSNNKVYTFGSTVLREACEGVTGWYFHGGNLASNGWIYCIPANANFVVKVNPATDEVVLIGPKMVGKQKWYGGIIGSDGNIYGIPHNAATVLKIDPRNDSVSTLSGTSGSLPEGNWKWHGGLAAGHKIIGFPNNADHILVIDCSKSQIYTTGGPHILKSGRHRIPQDGRYKYLGGALTENGRYAYLFPCDAERVLRVDCATDEMVLVGPCLLDGENKSQNGFAAKDGCLYGIPQRGAGVLRIKPSYDVDGSGDKVDIIPCGENMMGVKDKFEGGVLGLDGNIYCIPLRARACVKIIPE